MKRLKHIPKWDFPRMRSRFFRDFFEYLEWSDRKESPNGISLGCEVVFQRISSNTWNERVPKRPLPRTRNRFYKIFLVYLSWSNPKESKYGICRGCEVVFIGFSSYIWHGRILRNPNAAFAADAKSFFRDFFVWSDHKESKTGFSADTKSL